MQIPRLINLIHGDMTAWRQDLHVHPELGFEEHRISDFVAGKLAEFGCEVHRNIRKTGVVGVLRTGNGPSIVLRADMDALPIHEANDVPYHRSKHEGIMHACGHDGHTTMLLGAARYLAETRDFAGTVIFIFQSLGCTTGPTCRLESSQFAQAR
jgi:hippurate hydrolase